MRVSGKNARTVSTSSFEPAIKSGSAGLRPSPPIPQAARTASRRWPGRAAARRCRRRTDRRWRARRDRACRSPRTRPKSFSVISLTAARDRSRLPVSSVNVSSMSRVDRPGARKVRPPAASSSRVRPESAARTPEMNGSGVSRTCGLRIVHRPFRGLHLARPIAIAVAGLLPIAALVAPPSRPSTSATSFAPECLLDDQAQRQPHQIAPPAAVPRSPFISPRSSLAVAPARIVSPLGCSLRATAPSPPSCCDSGRVHPNPFSSKLKPSPWRSPRRRENRCARPCRDSAPRLALERFPIHALCRGPASASIFPSAKHFIEDFAVTDRCLH